MDPCRLNEMNPDELTDEIMECGCSRSHDEKANELLMYLAYSVAELWPTAQGGEFELRVNDAEGNGVVYFGGSVGPLPEGYGPERCHN